MATDIKEKIDKAMGAGLNQQPEDMTEQRKTLEQIIELLSPFKSSAKDTQSISNSFFYRIEGKGKVFHILGSLHTWHASKLAENVKAWAKATKVLMIEAIREQYVLLDRKEEIGLELSVYQLGKEPHPEKSPLHGLPKKQKEKLEKIFGKNLYKIQPWVLYYLYDVGRLKFDSITSEDHSETEAPAAVQGTKDESEAVDVVEADKFYKIPDVLESKKQFEELVIEDGISFLVQKSGGMETALETQADCVIAEGLNNFTFEYLLKLLKPEGNSETKKEDHDKLNPGEIEIAELKLKLEKIKSAYNLNEFYQSGEIFGFQDFYDARRLGGEFQLIESLKTRNKTWIPKILDGVRNSKSCEFMLIVGLSHLILERNVLELLEEEGFTVTRVIEDEKTKREDFLISYRIAERTSRIWSGWLKQAMQSLLAATVETIKSDGPIAQSFGIQSAGQVAANVVSVAAQVVERKLDPTMVVWAFNAHQRLERLGRTAEFRELDESLPGFGALNRELNRKRSEALWTTIALRGLY